MALSAREHLSLQLIASLPDPVRLQFQLSSTPPSTHDDEEEDDEGRADDGATLTKTPNEMDEVCSQDFSWLDECIIDCWGQLEYIAIARGSIIMLIGKRGNSIGTIFSKPLKLERDDEISSILLMGIASRRVQGSIDGAVCILGTSDGFIFVVSETSTLLFSHKFSTSPITAIRSSSSDIILITATEIILIRRPSLFSLVNELRKHKSKGSKTDLEYCVLTRNGESVNVDGCPCPVVPTIMDKYADSSLSNFHGGIEYRRGDYVWWMALRDELGARGIWDKEQREGVKDTILKWGTQYLPSFVQNAMLSHELTPFETRTCREWRECGECRLSLSLHPAPSPSPFIAMADNLARVVLMDMSCGGEIIRVWKGYRDASCAWMKVDGIEGKSTLFLVILAPRRNVLEVWSAPNGRRVAARQVRAVGLIQSTMHILCQRDDDKESSSRLYLIGYMGNIFEISVSLESLLVMSTNDDSHDRILLKEMESLSFTSLSTILTQLKTREAKRSALLSCIHTAIQVEETICVLEELSEMESISSLSSPLLQLCRTYQRILSLSEVQSMETMDDYRLRELMPLVLPCLVCTDNQLVSPLSLSSFLLSFNLHSTPFKLNMPSPDTSFLNFLFLPFIEGKVEVDELICIATSLHISTDELSSLMTQFILSTCSLSPCHLSPILSLLHNLSSTSPTIRSLIRKMSLESPQILRGAVLLALLSTKGTKDEEGDEFEKVRDDVQRMDSLLRVAPILFELSSLMTPYWSSPICIEVFLQTGPPMIREMIAHWTCCERLSPSDLFCHSSLLSLQSYLPLSLDSSLISCDCAWLILREWTGKSSFHFFSLSLQYASSIKDMSLRCGCVSLLWEKCLLGAFRSLTKEDGRMNEGGDIHARLVPTYKIADFVSSLFSLLSSCQGIEGGRKRATPLMEEWLGVLFEEDSNERHIHGESVVEVVSRQSALDPHSLTLHRQLVAAFHLKLGMGRCSMSLIDLFPLSIQSALFTSLSNPMTLPSNVDISLIEKRMSFMDKACAYPSSTTRQSLLYLCREWDTMDMLHVAECRQLLRESKDKEASVRLSLIPPSLRSSLLVPAIATRLKLLANDQTILLSTKDEKTLSDLAGDELTDCATLSSVTSLLSSLIALSPTSIYTRQLTHITSTYFGVDI